jgi:pimeloyl-ACP methyl ester carboxylesterase
MHGAIGSPVRRSAELEAVIAAHRLRYVMVDRPGFCGSDRAPDRTVGSFARDVEDLADALGFERFSVVGCSAGGPYVLACAWGIPDRVAATAAIGALPPGLPAWRARGMSVGLRLALSALLAAPRLTAALGDRAVAVIRRHPGALARALALAAPPADRDLLADPEARETAARSFLAAAARGVAPMVEDYVICSRPWGFDAGQVRAPVHLWHGLHDHLVPFAHARRLADALPDCRLTVADGDGHFFFRARLPEILVPLAEALGPTPSPRELAA